MRNEISFFPNLFSRVWQSLAKVISKLTKTYVFSKLMRQHQQHGSRIWSQLNLAGNEGRDADKYFYRQSWSPFALITQNTRLSQPVIGRVLTNMFSKRTQMPHAIHAGRFSRLHFLEHHYTFVGDDYWWHRCRSIQRSQMVRDRNYTGAPINYYQAVCHPHETINSVAPVHRRADKLSRLAARASPLVHTHPFLFMYIFSFSDIRDVI